MIRLDMTDREYIIILKCIEVYGIYPYLRIQHDNIH